MGSASGLALQSSTKPTAFHTAPARRATPCCRSLCRQLAHCGPNNGERQGTSFRRPAKPGNMKAAGQAKQHPVVMPGHEGVDMGQQDLPECQKKWQETRQELLEVQQELLKGQQDLQTGFTVLNGVLAAIAILP